MKAIQLNAFGEADVLDFSDVAVPVPRDDEVLIKVVAAGVSLVDVRQRLGTYNQAATRVGGISFPHVPGSQAVGTIVALGSTAHRALQGRKVVAHVRKGAYAEYLIAPESDCVVVPDDADEAVLAAIPMQGLTAYCLLTESTALKKGESVLVHAAGGGVGSIAVQIAKIMGAGPVIATAATPEKREYALAIGADFAIDYEAPDWTSQVLQATSGRGVDVLLESIGGDVFERNFECLADFGRCVIFGSARGPGKPVEPRRLMTRCQSLAGFYLPVLYADVERTSRGLQFLVDHVVAGNINVRIAEEIPLAEASRAHRMLEAREVIGAVVLRP